MNRARAALGGMPAQAGAMPEGPANAAGGEAAPGGAEILVVDAGIDVPDILVNGCRRGVGVHRLEAGGRGLEQIAAGLGKRRDVSVLHLLSRGEPGALLLAGDRIDLPALAMRPALLVELSEAFRPDAVLVLYGGSVACGPAGLRFLDYLETALGITVAASATPVGAAALGGRWTLRDRYGNPVQTAFSPLSRATYPALLSGVRA